MAVWLMDSVIISLLQLEQLRYHFMDVLGISISKNVI